MSHSTQVSDEKVLPTQVWQCLSVDQQFEIMRLLAQLALNLVMAQSNAVSKFPEVTYALPIQSTKDQA